MCTIFICLCFNHIMKKFNFKNLTLSWDYLFFSKIYRSYESLSKLLDQELEVISAMMQPQLQMSKHVECWSSLSVSCSGATHQWFFWRSNDQSMKWKEFDDLLSPKILSRPFLLMRNFELFKPWWVIQSCRICCWTWHETKSNDWRSQKQAEF